jgi:hypothetical protein
MVRAVSFMPETSRQTNHQTHVMPRAASFMATHAAGASSYVGPVVSRVVPRAESFMAQHPTAENRYLVTPRAESFMAQHPNAENRYLLTQRAESFMAQHPAAGNRSLLSARVESFMAYYPAAANSYAATPACRVASFSGTESAAPALVQTYASAVLAGPPRAPARHMPTIGEEISHELRIQMMRKAVMAGT